MMDDYVASFKRYVGGPSGRREQLGAELAKTMVVSDRKLRGGFAGAGIPSVGTQTL